MALTASRNLKWRGTKTLGYGTILTAAKIYKGAILARMANGKITVAANAATLNFAGIAEREYDAGDGTIQAEFAYGHEVQITVAASVTVALVNDTAIYAADDENATTATTLGPPIGRLKGFEPLTSGYAWIHIGQATQATQT